MATCSHWRGAVDLVRLALAGREERYELRLVYVDSFEKARELRFIGSPTIRINGRDVDEDGVDRDVEPSLGHRVYRSANGTARTPELRAIEIAIERAEE